jgi:hypothetical protein
MKDTLGQFARLKNRLTAERDTITKRLAAINAVLGTADLQTGHGNGKNVQPSAIKGGTGKLTLDQAVLDAFGGEKGNGKTVAELLSLVQATAGETHKVTPATVGLACFRLKKKKQIKNVGRGMYTSV